MLSRYNLCNTPTFVLLYIIIFRCIHFIHLQELFLSRNNLHDNPTFVLLYIIILHPFSWHMTPGQYNVERGSVHKCVNKVKSYPSTISDHCHNVQVKKYTNHCVLLVFGLMWECLLNPYVVFFNRLNNTTTLIYIIYQLVYL